MHVTGLSPNQETRAFRENQGILFSIRESREKERYFEKSGKSGKL